MSHTHKHDLANAVRHGRPTHQHEPFADERWGDARKVRSRLKRRARRLLRHRLTDPRINEEASAQERAPRVPVFWRHQDLPVSQVG